MRFVVIWRNPATGELVRSGVFAGPGAAGDAHAYAIMKTPPKGFVFQAISAIDDPCSDCPPVDYPTDATRCAPCLRRPEVA